MALPRIAMVVVPVGWGSMIEQFELGFRSNPGPDSVILSNQEHGFRTVNKSISNWQT